MNRRLQLTLLLALATGTVTGGDIFRSVAALRNGGSGFEILPAAVAGLLLFSAITVLGRIAVVAGRPRGGGRSRIPR